MLFLHLLHQLLEVLVVVDSPLLQRLSDTSSNLSSHFPLFLSSLVGNLLATAFFGAARRGRAGTRAGTRT